eukprot:544060_1
MAINKVFKSWKSLMLLVPLALLLFMRQNVASSQCNYVWNTEVDQAVVAPNVCAAKNYARLYSYEYNCIYNQISNAYEIEFNFYNGSANCDVNYIDTSHTKRYNRTVWSDGSTNSKSVQYLCDGIDGGDCHVVINRFNNSQENGDECTKGPLIITFIAVTGPCLCNPNDVNASCYAWECTENGDYSRNRYTDSLCQDFDAFGTNLKYSYIDHNGCSFASIYDEIDGCGEGSVLPSTTKIPSVSPTQTTMYRSGKSSHFLLNYFLNIFVIIIVVVIF